MVILADGQRIQMRGEHPAGLFAGVLTARVPRPRQPSAVRVHPVRLPAANVRLLDEYRARLHHDTPQAGFGPSAGRWSFLAGT